MKLQRLIETVGVATLLGVASTVAAGVGTWTAQNGPWMTYGVTDITLGHETGNSLPTIYAADTVPGRSFFRSSNEGESWIRVPVVYTNPYTTVCNPINPSTVLIGCFFIAGPGDGVYWSGDQGQNWEPRNNGLTNLHPLCLAVALSDTARYYAGCDYPWPGEVGSVFKTTNSGQLWTNVSLPTPIAKVNDIAVDPGNPDRLFVGCNTQSGVSCVWRSLDGGASWQGASSGIGGWRIQSLAIDPTNPQVLYAGGGGHSLSYGVHKSTNGGDSWTRVLDLQTVCYGIVVDPDDPNYVFAATDGWGVYRSSNGGSTWVQVNTGLYDHQVWSLAFDRRIYHPPLGVLYAGAEETLYKSTDHGESWVEADVNMEQPNIWAVDAFLPLLYTKGQDGLSPIHRTTNSGTSWALVWPMIFGNVAPGHDLMVDHSNPDRGYGIHSDIEIGPMVFRTVDRGETWGYVLAPYAPSPGARGYALALDPTNSNRIYASADRCQFFRNQEPTNLVLSEDGGNNWTGLPNFGRNNNASVPDLAIDPVVPNVMYLSEKDIGQSLWKSVNAGVDWSPSNTGLPIPLTLNVVEVSPADHLNLLTGSSTVGTYKTTNGGAQWFASNAGLVHPDAVSLAWDPAEPEIVYAACQDAPGSTQGYVYATVDGGKQWSSISSGIPTDATVNDVDVDPRPEYSNIVFAGTKKGVFEYTVPWQFKSLTSASSSASDSNSQRKLVRQEGTSNLHAVYHSGNASVRNVYYVSSTDGGATWSRKILLGQGSFPAIALDESGNPQVLWVSDGDNELRYAYCQGGVWSAGQTLYIASASDKIGPPAFCAIHSVAGSRGQVVFNWKSGANQSTAVKYGWFTLNASGTLQNVVNVDSGTNSSSFCSRPSLSYSFSLGYYYLHASWAKGTNVWYSYKQLDSGPWTNTRISQTSATSSQPNIEFYGDAVNVAWVQTSSPVSVINRYRTFPYGSWSTWKTVSQAAGCASPQMASSAYCVWSEGDNEVYYAYRVGGVWQTKVYLSNTPERSASPQVTFMPWIMGTTLFCFWTENNAAPYQEYFATTIGPLGAFYTLDAGLEEASPYTVRRGGYLQYTQEPEKTVDTDGSYLTYRFDRLDPKMLYLIRASYYQETGSPVGLEVKVDGSVFANLAVPNRSVIRGEAWVPSELYADSVVEITIRKKSGTLGTLGYLELCQAEPKGKGGPQSSELADLNLPKEFSLGAGYPNPMTSEARISYALPKASSVDLTVYNISGQVVRCLVSEPSKAPGRYSMRWDGRNDQGHRVPGGVYFYRLKAGGFAETKKLVVIR